MTAAKSPFDASFQGLGYTHQFRSALLLGLKHVEELGYALCVEKLDDVSLHASDEPGADVLEMRQFKLHKNRDGHLGDSSVDIWKTLRVWAEAVAAGRVRPDRCRFILVTTAVSSPENAVRLLRPAGRDRDAEEARVALEAAGAKSKNDVVRTAHAALLELPEGVRRTLFERIELLEGDAAAVETAGAVEERLWFVAPDKRERVADGLFGWWQTTLCRHLAEESPPPILVAAVHQRVQDLVAEFGRGRLPDDLLGEDVPNNETPAEDERMFVRQLSLVGVAGRRLRIAQEDHYRAFSQRSQWFRGNLLGHREQEKFEGRLVDAWEERFEVMREKADGGGGDDRTRHGGDLYRWVSTDSPGRQDLWFRPDFPTQYMVKGSFHMLADGRRVGWHPDFQELLAPGDEADGRRGAGGR